MLGIRRNWDAAQAELVSDWIEATFHISTGATLSMI